MLKRVIVLTIAGLLLSGCYMIPMAFIGPATSGYTTASIVQSAVTTSASYMVKKSTGKSISEHVFGAMKEDVLQSTFFPEQYENNFIFPEKKLLNKNVVNKIKKIN